MANPRIEAIRIRGFRSLADIELTGLRGATALIGANGSGKSNFIRFFEMMSWMVRARRLDADRYRRWFDESFTPGELWQKNLLGGRP